MDSADVHVPLAQGAARAPAAGNLICGMRRRVAAVVAAGAVAAVTLLVVLPVVLVPHNGGGGGGGGGGRAHASGQGDGYQYWCVGTSCSSYVTVVPTAGYNYAGGGTDVDDAFAWMAASAQYGDFLILRTSGSDGYNDYIDALTGYRMNSITSILITAAPGASAAFVLDAVAAADTIFLAGGDQTLYAQLFPGTPLAAALRARAANVTVGGTSAGAMYLGHIVFTPPSDADSVTSAIALADPYAPAIQFNPSLFTVPVFATGGARRVLVDTHFAQRDRMGRLLTFGSRLVQDGNVSVAGGQCVYMVAMNEASAFLISPTGHAPLVGGDDTSTGYVCTLCTAPTTCLPSTPLTAGPFDCQRLSRASHDAFNFQTWSGSGDPFTLSVVNGTIVGDPYGPPTLAFAKQQ